MALQALHGRINVVSLLELHDYAKLPITATSFHDILRRAENSDKIRRSVRDFRSSLFQMGGRKPMYAKNHNGQLSLSIRPKLFRKLYNPSLKDSSLMYALGYLKVQNQN